MLDYVKRLVRVDNVCIDNNVFKLHYKVTAVLLITCSLMVSTRQFFGDPIYCTVDGMPYDEAMDTYCWSHSRTTTAAFAARTSDAEYPMYLNGGGRAGRTDNGRGYSEWTFLALLVQAALFYGPWFVWKTWEAGRIRTIMFDLDSPVSTDTYRSERKKMLVEYFATNMHSHNLYAIRFFVCELMNTTNAVLQMLFINYVFGGEFTAYGPDMFWMTGMEQRSDPADAVFPRFTRCTFLARAAPGSVQSLDGVCVLPLNVINQKIYSFLWSWFMFVSLVSLLNTVYRLAIMTIPKVRLMLLTVRLTLVPRDHVVSICKKCEIGDWFVIYQLSKNLHPVIFREFLADLIEKLDADDIIAEYIMKLRTISIMKNKAAIKAREAARAIEIV